jgi:hypothetical protein
MPQIVELFIQIADREAKDDDAASAARMAVPGRGAIGGLAQAGRYNPCAWSTGT